MNSFSAVHFLGCSIFLSYFVGTGLQAEQRAAEERARELERLRQEELANQEAARQKKMARNRKKKAARTAKQQQRADVDGGSSSHQQPSSDVTEGNDDEEDEEDDDDDMEDVDDDAADNGDSKSAELVEMYAVEMNWVLGWNKHVEHKGPNPGPISNHLLLTEDRKTVRPDLAKGTHFELVPAKTWQQLIKVWPIIPFHQVI